ncbi:phage tail protein I [Sphingomonas sp. Leaf38]|uniref:phage tail protein I n=1 Tax=Sphingomonas sp. Leaf38 TaxID=1736217 RepID=UPI0006FFFB94|nr:phage tail protein I [Sphingomonas sp. Leaf38]KQN29702.1 phage tail protein I [Sphingomonas sp. Leaf38]
MTLLPPNATALERALEIATSRIGDVPIPLAPLWDPATCPGDILPWLAWSLSVDRWDADWPEARKRAAIAGSIALHRIKGTRASVEAVIASFDALIELVEWHQTAPRGAAHTFEVVIPMVTAPGSAPGGARASVAFVDQIGREVSRVKPLREHFKVVQLVTLAGAIGVRAAARLSSFIRENANLTIDVSPEWQFFLQTEDGEPLEGDDGAYLDTRP